MCPSSDENDLAEPRVKRINELRKGFEFGTLLAHASDDSNAEDRILLQIMSACSLPRDRCHPTSRRRWLRESRREPHVVAQEKSRDLASDTVQCVHGEQILSSVDGPSFLRPFKREVVLLTFYRRRSTFL
jgi:hypothetical protein